MKLASALPSSKRSAYFPALTGVRALAAYLVFVYHIRITESIPQAVTLFFNGGKIGVAIFFVLSGFLIAYRYTGTLQTGRVSYGHYLFRRAARLYPVYVAVTILMLLWKNNQSLVSWFLNLTLLKGYFKQAIQTGIAQGWSLTVEETFYLAVPLLFPAFNKLKSGSILLLLLAGAALVFLADMFGSTNFMADLEFMFTTTLFGRCFEFYCGYQLALAIKKRPQLNRKGILFTGLGSVLMICSILILGFAHKVSFIDFIPYSFAIVVNNFLVPVVTSLWFYGLITEKSILRTFLGSRLLQILGKSSYAFYLIHLGWFPEFIHFHIFPGHFAEFIFLNLWAIGIFYFLEEPLNQFLRKRFEGHYFSGSIFQQFNKSAH